MRGSRRRPRSSCRLFTLLVDLVVAAGPGDHPFTTLAEIDEHYARIAREYGERLRAEKLDRHEAVHAIGAVLAEHMRQIIATRVTLLIPIQSISLLWTV